DSRRVSDTPSSISPRIPPNRCLTPEGCQTPIISTEPRICRGVAGSLRVSPGAGSARLAGTMAMSTRRVGILYVQAVRIGYTSRFTRRNIPVHRASQACYLLPDKVLETLHDLRSFPFSHVRRHDEGAGRADVAAPDPG